MFYLCYYTNRAVCESFEDPDDAVARWEQLGQPDESYLFCGDDAENPIYDGECPNELDYILVDVAWNTWSAVTRADGHKRQLDDKNRDLLGFQMRDSNI